MTESREYSTANETDAERAAVAAALLRPYESPILRLPNRIVMAPMTRNRADRDGVPHPLAPAYYGQRAGAGLIITEGIWPAAIGRGLPGVPGLVTERQLAAWETVTTAVHAAGGRIFAQLWHVGRVTHPSTLGGQSPIAPSPIAADGTVHVGTEKLPHVRPREMSATDIEETIAAHAAAARNAIAVGFDGVEIHAANGYLLHQFLAPNTNRRTDAYRDGARFVFEVVDAVTAAIGANRVAIRLSPGNPENSLHETEPAISYPPLISTLDSYGLAYLHVSEKSAYPAIAEARKNWTGTLIGNYDPPAATTPETGACLLASGDADLVAFGRLFIANPDLPARLAAGAPLATADSADYYRPAVAGYVDASPIDLVPTYGGVSAR